MNEEVCFYYGLGELAWTRLIRFFSFFWFALPMLPILWYSTFLIKSTENVLVLLLTLVLVCCWCSRLLSNVVDVRNNPLFSSTMGVSMPTFFVCFVVFSSFLLTASKSWSCSQGSVYYHCLPKFGYSSCLTDSMLIWGSAAKPLSSSFDKSWLMYIC